MLWKVSMGLLMQKVNVQPHLSLGKIWTKRRNTGDRSTKKILEGLSDEKNEFSLTLEKVSGSTVNSGSHICAKNIPGWKGWDKIPGECRCCKKLPEGWKGVGYRKYFQGAYLGNEKYFQEVSIFFNIPGEQDPQKVFQETQFVRDKTDKKETKKLGVTVILGRVELVLKSYRLNMRQESGNIKPVWLLLGYWCKGNIFRRSIEILTLLVFQQHTNMSLNSF